MVSTLAIYSECPGLNLGGETRYPDKDFRGFSQSLQANFGIVPEIPRPSDFIIIHPAIGRYIVCVVK
jgi:hypothetical protein